MALLLALAVTGSASAQALSDTERSRIEALAADTCDRLQSSYPDVSWNPAWRRTFLDHWLWCAERPLEPCPPVLDDAAVARLGGHARALPPGPLLRHASVPLVRGPDGRRSPLFVDPTVPPDDTLTTWIKVFLDQNEDGIFDQGEPGLDAIQLSNGMAAGPLGNGSVLTDPDGTHSFTTALWDSRFVFMTVPSGYTATTEFWHRLDPATNPDSVYFGLRATPATADSTFRLVQMSDVHVANMIEEGLEHGDDLSEIESLAVPPAFIVVTGDLTMTGDNEIQFQNYLAGLFGHATPIHQGYGDHDGILYQDPPAALKVVNFENWIGPTCYSFEYGGVHFIMYNDIHPVDVENLFKQEGWLAQDIFAARARSGPDLAFVICKHTMPAQQEIDLYTGLRLLGTFSGHWHGSRVREVQQVFDVNTPPSRFAGIDKSSRGFRIIDMDGGALTTEFREAGIADHLRVVMPADGDTVLASPLSFEVNAYASTALDLAVQYSLSGPGGTVATGVPMAVQGTWYWSADWDATLAPDGVYELTVTATPDVGAPFSEVIHFEVVRGDFLAQPDAYTDWPKYKYEPGGTGRSPYDLPPPLRLAWARNLGSPVNVPSPAVAQGRVFIGTSNISTTNEAHMVCLDAASGAVLWQVPTLNDVKSTPAVESGAVYFTNSTGTLFKLDAAGGDILWQAQLGDSLSRWEMTSPTYYDGTIYVGGAPAMSAVDAASGNILWQHVEASSDFFPAIYSTPAVNDEVAIFTSKFGIYVYDRLTGTERWKLEDSGNPSSSAWVHRSAAIVDSLGLVYTAGRAFASQRLRAYDITDGSLVYQASQNLYESTSAPVIGPGPGSDPVRVIIGNGGNQNELNPPFDGRLQSFVPPSNAVAWTRYLSPMISGSLPYKRHVVSINSTPAWAGSHVYFGADDGKLYCVDPDNGVRLWSYDLGVPLRSSPAVAGNMLFINGSDGTLYAFVSTFIEAAGVAAAAGGAPQRTRLLGNWPNPFNPSTTIRFDLAPAEAAGQVSLKIYDAAGRLVRRLLEAPLAPGSHSFTWDGRDGQGRRAASSVYLYELRAGEQRLRRKLVLTR